MILPSPYRVIAALPPLRTLAALTFCLLLRFTVEARAATVTAGTHFLTPNAPNQFITIMVTGGEQIAGVDFFLQVGDGGAAAGGDDLGPTIAGIDFGGPGIFATNNTGVFVESTPLLVAATTTTTMGTVAATGRLAILAISTAGITSGRYDLLLNPSTTGATQFPGVTTTLVNGWLQVGGEAPTTDFNGDGHVGAADLARWRTWYSLTGSATNAQGDADADSDVDGHDFLLWQRQITDTTTAVAAAPAPEPAALPLALVSVALATTLRRPCPFRAPCPRPCVGLLHSAALRTRERS